MKKLVQLTLGIMTALGGFVDLGQIVFTMQAGARFGYALLWSIVLGGGAIILYMEMCGRIAAVAQQPVFGVVRTTLDKRLGIATLVGSNLLNLITCAAELGAVAIVLHLLFGVPERLALVVGALLLGVLGWLLNFQWIERTFGLAGLTMLVFGLAAWRFRPHWGAAAAGLVPHAPHHGTNELLLYAYFAVGIFSAMLMAYEVHCYSSGAIEEGWTAKDLRQNSIVAFTGVVLGSLLTCALLILGAIVFLPRSIVPDLLSTTVLPVAVPLGPIAVRIALVGILACVASAAVETALSGGYNLCQFFGLKWNKNLPPQEAPVFTGTWVAMLLIALVLAMSGIKPLTLVNVSIIFGMLIMPLTYYPILKAAGDRALMGEHVTGKVQQTLGWVFFGIIVIAALAAFPLMILTHGGQFASVR
jgi:Mn2+/Fe2+ NRAMP family transporter